MEHNVHGHTLAGTVGGTLLVVLLQISGGEVLHTSLLAIIGAAVSFGASVGLKWLARKIRKTTSTNKNNKHGKI